MKYIIETETAPEGSKPLIECKDCMFYSKKVEGLCGFWHDLREPESYCNEAERKNE